MALSFSSSPVSTLCSVHNIKSHKTKLNSILFVWYIINKGLFFMKVVTGQMWTQYYFDIRRTEWLEPWEILKLFGWHWRRHIDTSLLIKQIVQQLDPIHIYYQPSDLQFNRKTSCVLDITKGRWGGSDKERSSKTNTETNQDGCSCCVPNRTFLY